MRTASELSPRWQLVAAHRTRLLRMARRRTVSEHDAEDVVAEAMLRAVERPDVDEDRLPAWLTVVTVRLCLDIARERTRERRRWARADVATVAGSCEQGVCDRAEAAWVAERVAALPSRQARALRLRASGMDVAGIAQDLGVTYRTAESLLARGRATVRATLSATLVAAFLAACRWLRSTVSPGGGVAAAAAVSAAGVAAVVTVMLGPAPPDAAAPARTAPKATDMATVPQHPRGTAEVPPPTPQTATDSAPAEVPARHDVPPPATSTVPIQLPTQLPPVLPAVPSVSPPAAAPRLPASVPTELAVPAAAPSLPPAVSTNLIPNPG